MTDGDSLISLPLAKRVVNALGRAGIKTRAELRQYSADELFVHMVSSGYTFGEKAYKTIAPYCRARRKWTPAPRLGLSSGYITYFRYERDRNRVKIGRTLDPDTRFSQPTDSSEDLELLGMLDGDREREMHDRFQRLHVRREWFECRGELAAFLVAEFGVTLNVTT